MIKYNVTLLMNELIKSTILQRYCQYTGLLPDNHFNLLVHYLFPYFEKKTNSTCFMLNIIKFSIPQVLSS